MFTIFRRARFFYKKLRLQRLRYALPFLLLVLYTVAGAYVFRYFELQEDEWRRSRYRENTEYAFKRTLNRMLEVKCQEGLDENDRTLQTRHVKEHLFWLMDYLNLTQVIEERSESSPWTWMGAMFYAGQLYTTIGYGLPITQTPGGRLASIVYIMIGIPLFLLILAEVGKLLSRGLRKLYKRVHKMKRLPEAARRMSEPMKALYQLTAAMASTAIGPSAAPLINGTTLTKAEEAHKEETQRREAQKEEEMKAAKAAASNGGAERKSFPIAWALAILIVWIMFSSGLFCVWETEWGYMTSIYFFFVSISTVGLGDLVPTKPDMMIVNFFMILIGLALLSMCVTLIQEALEKLIERLIEQYIDEIEKIAAVVTNNEVNEFTEDLEPFEVGMTEMLTVPVTTLGGNDHKMTGIGRSVKDWIAERASNMLLNKIYPEESEDSSSESGSEEEEEKGAEELEEVVVIDREPVMLHGAAKVTVHRSSLVQQLERRSGEAGQLLPQISIHEGTPDAAQQMEIRNGAGKLMDGAAPIGHPRKVAIQQGGEGRNTSSIASTPTREGSAKKKKAKKPPKVPKFYAGALLKYSAPTMQAIQAIEYAKLRTGRSNDFKSRLFAKFATNQRFAQIVESNAPPPKHMVSSSIQTSPILPPRHKSWRLRKMNCAVESIDSTSSELNATTTSRTNASCSANDLDSLYSNTYFDMCFGNYNTDSVPCLMAQPNTPQQQPQLGEGDQPSLVVRRKFSEKLFGLFGRIIPGRQAEGEEEAAVKDALAQENGQKPPKKRPLSQCHSSPSTPATNRRYLNENANSPSIPTTPLIQMTGPTNEQQLRISLTPTSPSQEIDSNAVQKSTQEFQERGHQKHSPMVPNPIGHVVPPTHHRALSTRRRFSASNLCLSPPPRSTSLTALNQRRKRPILLNPEKMPKTNRTKTSNGEELSDLSQSRNSISRIIGEQADEKAINEK